MLLQASYFIKCRTWPIWLVLALPSIPALIFVSQNPTSKLNVYFLGLLVLFALLLFGISKAYKIYIDDEELVFHAFGRKRGMKWVEIKSSAIRWTTEAGHSAGLSWQFHAFDGRQIEIPLGYYSRNDMQTLAIQLISKAKAATISSRIHDFARGKFPWYLF